MIQISNLSGGYPDKLVLQNVTLQIPAGQVTILVGPNGCGKSTLLKTMVGILPRRAGQLVIGGRDMDAYSRSELAGKITYLPQNRQVPDMTAGRMVLHGRFPYLRYPRQYSREDLRIAREAMLALDIADLADTPMTKLSGGMQQKVYIAMALAQDTEAVLLDEPTTFLDAGHQLQLMDMLRALAERGKAVVCVLHDLVLAMEVADVLIVMEQGRVVDVGAPEAIFQRGSLSRTFGVQLLRTDTPWGIKYLYRKAACR